MDFGKDTDNSVMSYVHITQDGISFGPRPMKTTHLPKQYIFNGNTTILIHEDKSKTIVKTMEGDEFDPVLGFLTAYFQKHSGLSKNKANEYLEEVRNKYEETLNKKVKKVEEPREETPTYEEIASMYDEPCEEVKTESTSKRKFKVGDIVKIVASKRGHEFKIGETVRIKEIDYSGFDYKAEYLDGHDFWFVIDEELELVNESCHVEKDVEEVKQYKFKVGDKVIGNEKADERYVLTTTGWIGTVIDVYEDYFKTDEFDLDYEYFDLYEESEEN